jgi:hypothetical protein
LLALVSETRIRSRVWASDDDHPAFVCSSPAGRRPFDHQVLTLISWVIASSLASEDGKWRIFAIRNAIPSMNQTHLFLRMSLVKEHLPKNRPSETDSPSAPHKLPTKILAWILLRHTLSISIFNRLLTAEKNAFAF